MRRSNTKSRLARSAASVLEALEQRMLMNAAATLVKTDTTTQGTWTGTYGADGYEVVGGNTSLPSYATVAVANNMYYVWEAPGTSDPRALQTAPSSSTRVAATDYSNSGSFNVNVDITDGQTHQLALYLLDGDNQGRSETVTATDLSNNAQLSTTNVTSFKEGEYLVYNVSGNVQFTISNDPGSLNCVMSGIFFDPSTTSGGGGGSSQAPATASYIGTDSTTQGSWNGVYGQGGYSVVGGSTSLPSDVTFSVTGSQFYEWEAPGTTDPRALQATANAVQRVAACDYSNSGSFSMNVDTTDGQSHEVALYLLDEDHFNRSETIQIVDANSNTVLSSQNVSNFTGGVYLLYNITGDVKINVINGSGSLNCVVSGIFFSNGTGGTSPTAPTTLTVGPGKEFATIQSAVNAASNGDTVDVYSGTYKEQVVLPGNVTGLTLESAKGQTVFVEPPTGNMTSTGAIIEDDGGNNDTIQGFNVMGPGATTGALRFGILIDGGATGVNVLDNNVSYIGDDNFAGFNATSFASTGTPGETGIGIALTDGSATISGNIVTNYQKTGILVGLTPDVTGSPTWIQNGLVENNTVTGVGAQMQVAAYGIEFVGLRATGTAQDNHVSDNIFTYPPLIGDGGGILVYNAGQVSVLSNIVTTNDTDIIIDGGQDANQNPLDGSNYAIVASNQVFNATYFDGIDLVDGVSKVTVQWNFVNNNDTDGIFIDANSMGNTIENNLVTNNKNYDIEDVTYSASNYQGAPLYGTFNFYYNDQFGNEGSNDPSLPSTNYFTP